MKKQVIAGLAAAMICVGAVGGTFAYLTSSPDAVTNTFTVGEGVTIELKEADVDELGVEIPNADRVTVNEYKLFPGREYMKDPRIDVAADSEECYVFVKVENGLTSIEDQSATIKSQMETLDWINKEGNIWYKAEKQPAGAEVYVFNTLTIDGEKTQEDLKALVDADANIVITACAVQADGFTNALDAWEAVPAEFK